MVDTVIVAGNGYLGGLDEATDARVLPINNFVVATEPLDEMLIPGEEAVSDSRFVVYYWHQTPDRRLVFGGGETYSHDFRPTFRLRAAASARVYPKLKDVKISHGWVALASPSTACRSSGGPKPNVFIAAGYSGQGVMLAPFVGHVIAEAVGGTMGRFDTFAKVLYCLPRRVAVALADAGGRNDLVQASRQHLSPECAQIRRNIGYYISRLSTTAR